MHLYHFALFVRTNPLLLFQLCLLWCKFSTCEKIVRFRRQSNDNDYCIPYDAYWTSRSSFQCQCHFVLLTSIFIRHFIVSIGLFHERNEHNLHWNKSKCLGVNLWQFVHWSPWTLKIDKWCAFFKKNIEIHKLCPRWIHTKFVISGKIHGKK